MDALNPQQELLENLLGLRGDHAGCSRCSLGVYEGHEVEPPALFAFWALPDGGPDEVLKARNHRLPKGKLLGAACSRRWSCRRC
eukprot:2787627-Pyramimonas_sp.AAC.2